MTHSHLSTFEGSNDPPLCTSLCFPAPTEVKNSSPWGRPFCVQLYRVLANPSRLCKGRTRRTPVPKGETTLDSPHQYPLVLSRIGLSRSQARCVRSLKKQGGGRRASSDAAPLSYCSGIPMAHQAEITYRFATDADAWPIAKLHAHSWRKHYRGMLRDEYLDGDVVSERFAVWTQRLKAPAQNQSVVVAQADEALLGFICVYAQHDATWGTLIDNLHVHSDAIGTGIGTALLRYAAAALGPPGGQGPAYLWVMQGNDRARRFYEHRGGHFIEEAWLELPGDSSALNCRYAWTSIESLASLPTPQLVS